MTDLPPVTGTICNQCPWRRVAAPGWLGPYDAQEWNAIAHSDAPVACHITIREDEDWEGARQCAGLAQFRTNVFKSPRDKQVATAAERDTTEVFASSAEFLAHHEKKEQYGTSE